MKIVPVAADSMGARSMCTLVTTNDISLITDPSVALGPWRYNKPPHPVEIKRRETLWRRVKRYAAKADVIAITHYHYDHHNPAYPELYKDKILLIKHPEKDINKSQRQRAAKFLKAIEGLPSEIMYADGGEFFFDDTSIIFSKPVLHGHNEKMGYVVELCVDDGERFVYTSDIEGPCTKEQADFIIEMNPGTLYCDGPMTYMLGFRYPQKSLDDSINNLLRIIDETDIKTIIMEHHLLRDAVWRERIQPVMAHARNSRVKVMNAAQYKGEQERQYEALRNRLYVEEPVNISRAKKDYWKGV